MDVIQLDKKKNKKQKTLKNKKEQPQKQALHSY